MEVKALLVSLRFDDHVPSNEDLREFMEQYKALLVGSGLRGHQYVLWCKNEEAKKTLLELGKFKIRGKDRPILN